MEGIPSQRRGGSAEEKTVNVDDQEENWGYKEVKLGVRGEDDAQ